MRLEIVRLSNLLQKFDVLVLYLLQSNLLWLIVNLAQSKSETRQEPLLLCLLLLFLFFLFTEVSKVHLLLEYDHVHFVLELAEEDLCLAVDFELRDEQQVLADDGLALDNDVVLTAAEVATDTDKLI